MSMTYSYLHTLLCDLLHTSHHILFHLDELRQLLGEVGPEGTTSIATKCMA